mmetsp:Transcript_23026/g.64616  ORF Transcript_23026/g.64616 Transcript_23026/m.64616 type:complete len:238 (+) Transcript_23026:792-1505(+)
MPRSGPLARRLQAAAVPRAPHGARLLGPLRGRRGDVRRASGGRRCAGSRRRALDHPEATHLAGTVLEAAAGGVRVDGVPLRDDVAAARRAGLAGPGGPPARHQRLGAPPSLGAHQEGHRAGPGRVPLPRREAEPGRERQVALGLFQRARCAGRRVDRLLRRLRLAEVPGLRAHRREPGGSHGRARAVARVEDAGRRVGVLLHVAQRRRGRQRRRLPRRVGRPVLGAHAPRLDLGGRV